VLAILGYLALIPSQLALQFAAPPESLQTPAALTPAETTASIGRTQSILLAVSPLLTATTTPSALISAALAAKPAGIAIDHISYGGSDRNIMLSGTGSRDAINAYRDLVAKDAHFSSVSVPVSALVGESGHFSMTIAIAQPQ
jgi:hypothetical protein